MASQMDRPQLADSVNTAQAQPVPSKTFPVQSLSLWRRVALGIRIWTFKSFVTVALGTLRLVRPSHFRSIAPTYTKTYKIHPKLECRVFLPQTYKSGSKLPLYIDIHGGGFALCDPQTDDSFCKHLANEYGYCVVSINYRKAPAYPFPHPVNDCADLAKAVLSDDDLPFDHDKVVLGGFSAGANLSLAIAQLPGVKEKIHALVPIYPVVDFSGQYRGEYKTGKDGKEDLLKNSAAMFNWAYVPRDTDRKDKRLSVIYATRQDLPQKIFFVGAEYDYLCHEANIMARKLAGIYDEPDLGPNWSRNGIKWEEVPDVQHGFTHVELRGKKEVERLKMCDALYGRINEWIKSEVVK